MKSKIHVTLSVKIVWFAEEIRDTNYVVFKTLNICNFDALAGI